MSRLLEKIFRLQTVVSLLLMLFLLFESVTIAISVILFFLKPRARTAPSHRLTTSRRARRGSRGKLTTSDASLPIGTRVNLALIISITTILVVRITITALSMVVQWGRKNRLRFWIQPLKLSAAAGIMN
jgi:cell division protein FtsL